MESKVRKLCITQGFTLGVKELIFIDNLLSSVMLFLLYRWSSQCWPEGILQYVIFISSCNTYRWVVAVSHVYSIFIPRHRKYNQSECRKAVVYSAVYRPRFPWSIAWCKIVLQGTRRIFCSKTTRNHCVTSINLANPVTPGSPKPRKHWQKKNGHSYLDYHFQRFSLPFLIPQLGLKYSGFEFISIVAPSHTVSFPCVILPYGMLSNFPFLEANPL